MTDKKVYCSQCKYKKEDIDLSEFDKCEIEAPYTFTATWDKPEHTVQYHPYCQHKNKDNDCPDFEHIPVEVAGDPFEHSVGTRVEPKKPWWKRIFGL